METTDASINVLAGGDGTTERLSRLELEVANCLKS